MNDQENALNVFTLNQLEQLGQSLGSKHKKILKKSSNTLLPRLKRNEEILNNAYKLITASILKGNKTTPAGEWLLDNYHVIDEQIRTAKLHLPRGFSLKLPVVDNPTWKQQPRVYILARELINHTDGRLDKDSLLSVVKSYQRQTPFELGELWAFPIMLRLSLIDNIRKIAESIAVSDIDIRNAQIWSDKIIKTAKCNPNNIILDIADLASSNPRLTSAFVSEFSRLIQTQCHRPGLSLEWMEQRVGEHGLSIDQHQYLFSQNQAHDQMSMSNSITSLRFLNETDWRDFVESVSEVHLILSEDPSGDYTKMDFATRDSYRHKVEYMARYSKYSETSVAALALAKAQTNKIHIGELFLGTELQSFESSLRINRPWRDKLRQGISEFPLTFYLFFLTFFIGLLAGFPLLVLFDQNNALWPTIAFAILLLFPASQAALGVVNWLTTLLVKPKPWPRMDFSKGIPQQLSTVVIIPSMLSDEQGIAKLLDDIEVHYLANRDAHLYFALLTDFKDSNVEITELDQKFLEQAEEGVRSLNQKYERLTDRKPFYLFHRPRRWNVKEKVWMGYERKRGKIEAFNHFARGTCQNAFMSIVGEVYQLSHVRFAITLDADTMLPRDAAQKLVATLAHPLNVPKLDPITKVVRKGYAILQPRVTIHLQQMDTSLFSRLFSHDFGVDPYTKSTSDVYQDLFSEGSFIGKGIYDIEAFQKSLDGRFPENRILSHDLIESGFARSGLVSDIQLVEEYPSDYIIDMRRKHRWIRGDWQIASWIFPVITNRNGNFTKNPLSYLLRWKILDNVRRSLSSIAALALFICLWAMNLSTHLFVGLWLLIYLTLPQILHALNLKIFFNSEFTLINACREQIKNMSRSLLHAFFNVLFLPYEAYLSADAAIRSIYRLFISKKNLLEWQTAYEASKGKIDHPWGYYRLMWISPLAAGVGLYYIFAAFDQKDYFSISLCLLWGLAPWLAWWISKPIKRKIIPFDPSQDIFLRSLSRRTWGFFEKFVTEEDHWLPPDNFQEYPNEVIAHRTSPTNIGLTLLSTLGAFDFGYISLNNLVLRIDSALTSLESMERYKGHFYNWYDTVTLKPLMPQYVSTVDSGNLAGCLLVLRQGLRQIANAKLWVDRILLAVEDSKMIIDELLLNNRKISIVLHDKLFVFEKLLKKVSDELNEGKLRGENELDLYRCHLPLLYSAGKDIDLALVDFYKDKKANKESIELKEWVDSLLFQMEDHIQCFNQIMEEGGTESNRYYGRHSLQQKLDQIADRCTDLMNQDYLFLYNSENKLLSIGYNVSEGRRDLSYYDLLASEARLASFFAIADGSLPQEHWFALGRQLAAGEKTSPLLSWSGSMFEYLMPMLIFPTYDGTLLNQSCRQCVERQIQYGRERGIPWGISESGYNITDSQHNYQYKAFGVPGLGFKRGLEQDLVVAPYATIMALMLEPQLAFHNLAAMRKKGFMGQYGFYEAIDYTPSRLPAGQSHVVIKSFMAHHQGMSFLSLAYFLLDQPMQNRLKSEPSFRATELLLHERVPKIIAKTSKVFLGPDLSISPLSEEKKFRRLSDPNTAVPEVHLLGNEGYHVMITAAGSGASMWKNIQLTRWHEDRTRDAYGLFVYFKDTSQNKVWSMGYQPLLNQGDDYEVIFSEGRAEIRRTDGDIETHMEVGVSPDEAIELRRVTISNHGLEKKCLELTTYGEVVLTGEADDLSHPAFSNLFVETEIVGEEQGILAKRRAREAHRQFPLLFHSLIVHGGETENLGMETGRAEFIGRNRDLQNPQGLEQNLPNRTGAVLDPIVSIKKKITIHPGQTIVADLILGVSEHRADAINQISRMEDKQIADRILDLASTHGHVLLQQLNCSAQDGVLYGELASFLIYGGYYTAQQREMKKINTKPKSALWSYGISGDYPMVLMRLENKEDLSILKKLIYGHVYWRRKGLTVDLVLWNECAVSYRGEMHDKILEVLVMTSTLSLLDKHGGIYIRRPDQMPDEDKICFLSFARLVLTDQLGDLKEQMTAIKNAVAQGKILSGSKIRSKRLQLEFLKDLKKNENVNENVNEIENKKAFFEKLQFFNGIGGFSKNGHEYVIHVDQKHKTPMPWVNVIANEQFGTLISESGSAYTWSENAREHRISPWYNDPVSDRSGEAFYIRDEVGGEYWSPTLAPAPAPTSIAATYEVRHGFGYSQFRTKAFGIESVLTTFVAIHDPVKFVRLKLTNKSNRGRNLSLFSFFELVLGDFKSKNSDHIITEWDAHTGCLFAKNIFAGDFKGRIVFLYALNPVQSFTTDRREFIGRNRSLTNPKVMEYSELSGRVGSTYDPCLALQVKEEIKPGKTKEFVFAMGVGHGLEHVQKLIRQFSSVGRVQVAFANVKRFWTDLTQRLVFDLPNQKLNTLANGWLIYQTISSRIWGRTGYYQSGGAYGFRDQLQDMMAVVYYAPEIARSHILRCASRQYVEGDVQHWWHPPVGKGVRTSISDDFLWLPYVTLHYVKVTGDFKLLDEKITFLQGRRLSSGEESDYHLPTVSEEEGTLYEHCVRALRNGLARGEHGLPLMGSGDWNDGMNQVGIDGKGESVWLGFFQYDLFKKFAETAEFMQDHEFAQICKDEAVLLKKHVDRHAWDGEWYLRAFFDDGSPMGSKNNSECQIDSLPQSWSVLSDVADPLKAKTAMSSVYHRLVDEKKGLIKLFTPPFKNHTPNPGYISGYLQGVRENGGQYTHAATWAIMAFAKIGEYDYAHELLEMINPISHGDTEAKIECYKVEPYVISADVYSSPLHYGRGGWSWYTGAASWYFRTILEMILGFDLQGNKLRLTPRMPSHWSQFKISYKYFETTYHIDVKRNERLKESAMITLDQNECKYFIELKNDGHQHEIEVLLKE